MASTDLKNKKIRMKIYNEIIAQEKSHNSTYNLIDKQQLRQPSTYRGVKVRLLIFQIENL